MIAVMQLPRPRGPLSAGLRADLLAGSSVGTHTLAAAEALLATTSAPLTDEDLQLSLAICYELHYRGFDGVADSWEWDPELLRLRARLEERHTVALRELVGTVAVTDEPVDSQLAAVIDADDGPSLSRHLAKHGTVEQWREYLTVRSVYHLKEGDPHTWAIPRLAGRARCRDSDGPSSAAITAVSCWSTGSSVTATGATSSRSAARCRCSSTARSRNRSGCHSQASSTSSKPR
jgi:hypothetical protein